MIAGTKRAGAFDTGAWLINGPTPWSLAAPPFEKAFGLLLAFKMPSILRLLRGVGLNS